MIYTKISPAKVMLAHLTNFKGVSQESILKPMLYKLVGMHIDVLVGTIYNKVTQTIVLEVSGY